MLHTLVILDKNVKYHQPYPFKSFYKFSLYMSLEWDRS